MMKSMVKTYTHKSVLLTLLICLLGFGLVGQPDETGTGFIQHQVKPLETFYSLSKKYGITIDEIKKANPGLEYPKAGTKLLIPNTKIEVVQDPDPEFIIYTTKDDISLYILARMLRFPVDSLEKWNPGIASFLLKSSDIKTRPPNPGTEYILHTVTDERSSLRDLAQLYDLSNKVLKKFNPQIRNRVWFGQKVKVPVFQEDADLFTIIEVREEVPFETPEEEEEETGLTECARDPSNMERLYKVALLVPFSLEQLAELDDLLESPPGQIMERKPFRFIQFYQGFLLAADSLAQRGLKLELQVFDVDQNMYKAREVFAKKSLKDVDIIIGPFYKKVFPLASDFARAHGIPIVNPLTTRDDIFNGNPNVMKALPSHDSQIEVLASLVNYRFRDHNLVIVKENKYQGSRYILSLKERINQELGMVIPEVDYMTDSIAGLEKYLSDSLSNLVIVYAESEVLPMEILPLLNELNKEMEIEMIGVPEWSGYEHLENHYLINLRTLLLSGGFIDYTDPEIMHFISKFRTQFRAEPMEYAFNGYDLGYFFLSMLMDYGNEFADCLYSADYRLLHTRFSFKQVPGGGYSNTYWNIYYYNGFSLIRVPFLY
jgi:LysM repeat protein